MKYIKHTEEHRDNTSNSHVSNPRLNKSSISSEWKIYEDIYLFKNLCNN